MNLQLPGFLQRIFTSAAVATGNLKHAAEEVVIARQREAHAAKYASTPGKSLNFFANGTWQTEGQDAPTNISKMYRALEDFDDEGKPQLSKHIDGVGTGKTLWDKIFGGAFGFGIEEKIMEGYEFLADHYRPGDKINLIGYSRGAFTVRSLAGMINKVGLVDWKKAADEMGLAEEEVRNDPALKKQVIQDLFDFYKDKDRPKVKPSDPQSVELRKKWSYADAEGNVTSKITALACFDTVGSLGIPAHILFSNLVNKIYQFHDTTLGWVVENAIQALAIDEMRSNFLPTVMKIGHATTKLVQRWFPGGHGIGGGKIVDANGKLDTGLADAVGLWMTQQLAPFMKFNKEKVEKSFKPNAGAQPEGEFFDPKSISSGEIAPREIGEGDEVDYPIVFNRAAQVAEKGYEYRPEPIVEVPGERARANAYASENGFPALAA